MCPMILKLMKSKFSFNGITQSPHVVVQAVLDIPHQKPETVAGRGLTKATVLQLLLWIESFQSWCKSQGQQECVRKQGTTLFAACHLKREPEIILWYKQIQIRFSKPYLYILYIYGPYLPNICSITTHLSSEDQKCQNGFKMWQQRSLLVLCLTSLWISFKSSKPAVPAEPARKRSFLTSSLLYKRK